ncbi:MAG: hypothetical protein U0235_13390 [Polyangiaceae bacterium]
MKVLLEAGDDQGKNVNYQVHVPPEVDGGRRRDAPGLLRPPLPDGARQGQDTKLGKNQPGILYPCAPARSVVAPRTTR